jgi:hypothetical protein
MNLALRVRELLHFDPDTGKFVWKAKSAARSNRIKVGTEAGSLGIHGYVIVGIDGKTFRAHRLAWLYVYGEWPRYIIDHINGNRADNRLSNLREASASLNASNLQRAKKSSQSGFLGACKNGKKWSAQIRKTGMPRYIGTFETPEQAHKAYLTARKDR